MVCDWIKFIFYTLFINKEEIGFIVIQIYDFLGHALAYVCRCIPSDFKNFFIEMTFFKH